MTTLWQRARSGAPTAFAAATAAASTPPSRLYAPPAALRPVLLYAAQTRASCCSSPFSAAIATTKASAPSSMLTSHGAIGASRVAHLPPAPRSHRRFSTTSHISAQDLYESLSTGDRLSLAKAITLVESTRHDHKVEAKTLLELLLQDSRRPKTTRRIVHGEKFNTTFRIGLSGAPGVGKSSFIETFGMYLISLGHRVAVLAVDPSSSMTGGSILGDKTRMTELSRHDDAFIRPSPSSCTLGGVARNTNEAILLCEAGGFDIILVETVGVGQSETMVADMVDMFVLLVAPGAGDELQGMKKGIVELSDLILVNKSDGQLEIPARMAQMEYISALKFVQSRTPNWKADVLRVSSAEKNGIDDAWKNMKQYYSQLISSNNLYQRRGLQQRRWMWKIIEQEIILRLQSDSKVKTLVQSLENEVTEGVVTSGHAAEVILDAFLRQDVLKGQ